jgi:hypothetical protein
MLRRQNRHRYEVAVQLRAKPCWTLPSWTLPAYPDLPGRKSPRRAHLTSEYMAVFSAESTLTLGSDGDELAADF